MTRRQFATLVALSLLAVGLVWYVAGDSLRTGTRLRAEFTSARALHPGDDVRILGVRVGEVLEVKPTDDLVVVTMQIEPGHQIPKESGAVILAPSLVSGRFVQLTGTAEDGPALGEGDTIPLARTAVPVEWDDIKEQLTVLSASLGPGKGETAGPLADALSGLADATRGNGAGLQESIVSASEAVATINRSRGDLFTSVRNLAVFLEAINTNDAAVREFATQLADVAAVLDTSKVQVRTLVSSANRTFRHLTSFVKTHGKQIGLTIKDARGLTGQLADLRLEVANILHLAPNTLANFYNIYNPSSGAFTGRPVLPYGGALSNVLCQSIYSVGGTLSDCQKLIGPLLDQFDLKNLPLSLSGPEQPGTPNVEGSP